MKLLFTGPLFDFSGFATVSRNFLRMLKQDERLDVVARPLKYDRLDNGQSFDIPEWMAPHLQKDLLNVDIVTQMTTCNVEAVPIPGVVNGLYTFFETDRLQPSWAQTAQSFDFLIVPSRFNAETLLRSGIRRPILVAAPPCDNDIYKKKYQPFEIKNAGNRTIFYNICQLSTKKGIDLLLRAYYAAFSSVPDDVLLVLKTYISMQDRQNDLTHVKSYIENVKMKTRIPTNKFPPVLPLIGTMSDEDIQSLHARGDAYVCSSRSEGWGIPVFDALAHGKTVISHDKTGLQDFVSTQNALIYNGCASFFYDMPHGDPGLFTGLEQCFEPSVAEMSMVMQRFYLLKKGAAEGQLNEANLKEWQAVLQKQQNAMMVGNKFDYRTIASKVTEQLISAHESWKATGVVRFDDKKEGAVAASIEESL